MRNLVSVVEGRLVVEPVGLDKFWGWRRRIEIPLDQVIGAAVDADAASTRKGIRYPGLAVPGVKWVGTFYKKGVKTYWNVRAGSDTVVILLGEGAPFERLHLTVDDARGVVDLVNAAAAGG